VLIVGRILLVGSLIMVVGRWRVLVVGLVVGLVVPLDRILLLHK
jgi:hypothetical protein